MRVRSNFHRVLVLAVLLGSLALPAGASSIELAGPCVAGGVYDPACDVDHDGDVDISDVQLAAGHWGQTGVYSADSWLLTGNAGTNPASNFLGTVDAQPLVLKVNNQSGLRLEPTGFDFSPNIIGGYRNNFVTPGAYGVTIGGGGVDGGTNGVTGNYGTVGGGAANRAAGGATVAGGSSNDASGNGAAVTGGILNRASGDYSSVPGGRHALASHYGEMAHAGGAFGGAAGSAQGSTYVLRREVPSSAGGGELFLDGISQRITVAANRALAFDVLIVARSNAGETSGWRVEGVIENSGGTTALIGTPLKTTLGEDDVTWDVAVDDTNDALAVIGYSNQSGDTIRFVATVRTTEVAW